MAKKSNTVRVKDDGMSVKDDPRVRDPVIFNRLKLMVEHEACHPAWGCVLYQMHRQGQLSNEQKEAGDIYQRIQYDWDRCQVVDPDVLPPEEQELWLKRIDRARERRKRAVEILGVGRRSVDWVVLENNQPQSERERLVIRDGLQLIANFFGRGRNK